MKRWLAYLLRPRSRRATVRAGETPPSTAADMGNSPANGQSIAITASERMDTQTDSQNTVMENIVSNPDFSQGLSSWNPNSCHGFVASDKSSYPNGIGPNSGGNYVILTRRTQSWQGLEQDITDRIAPGTEFTVLAFVRVCGDIHEPTTVQATLKLENHNSTTDFLRIERISASKERWEKLEGKFNLSNVPKRVVFYIEGPPPGVDLLIDSCTISYKKAVNSNSTVRTDDFIMNGDFSGGLHPWRPNCCHTYIASDWSGFLNGIKGNSGGNYAIVTKRTQTWQGLEQDITGKVNAGVEYYVFALVRVYGDFHGQIEVKATLRLENMDSSTSYVSVERVLASKDKWVKLEGTFALKTVPKSVVFYLEGPPPGVDLLIDCVNISCSSTSQLHETKPTFHTNLDETIIENPRFESELSNWSGRGCRIVRNDDFGAANHIRPSDGKYFAVATARSQTWNGIEQEITKRVQKKIQYYANATVRIFGSTNNSEVRLTLWYKVRNGREQYIGVAKGQVSDREWVKLEGKFLLYGEIVKAVAFLEGPPAGTDILINNFTVKRVTKVPSAPPPTLKNIPHGVNIVHNTDLTNGLTGWAPLGSCSLRIYTESPHMLPLIPNADNNNNYYYRNTPSGRYILVSNRTETWMGPSQVITEKLSLHVTYRVSAWVRVGPGSLGFEKVNVALSVDGQWVNGGQVDASGDKWYEVKGSFRLEKMVNKVTVYVQGPAPGVDLCVMGLKIFATDRRARFDYLKEKTDKIRKRDVVLKFHRAKTKNLKGATVKITQTHNSFPFGTCIGRYNIEHEDLADFFVKNFNWAVFENELKWYWTEAERGKINYNDSDFLLEFCRKHNKKVRGHCIFWEVEDTVQPWIKTLNQNELMNAVQNRLQSLLTRYKGMFAHHDVNNEMLHGSFYRDRLGQDIWAYMFREAHKLDPNALLFVNDYNVEDGCDPKSTPEKYIEQILDLQERGAVIGGIGIQGHINNPIGEIICDSLDKLSILGIPIWVTELDVTAINEHVRADDLEVVLREVFAHPGVEGVIFWGFMESFMWRENAHMVDADGTVNEAGKRYLALKEEWATRVEGRIGEEEELGFRGFHGGYDLEVVLPSGERVFRSFVVEKGESPLVLNVNL